jgi:hypothetical protein
MSHSGDAAEQMVKMSLDGVEVALKITGTGAKELLTFLAAALKSNNSTLKPKGKARLASMLKSGKALEIFSVKERDLQQFAQGAKQYGIVYSLLRNKKTSPDGLCDIMVKADDAPKISRLVERFKFATIDKAKIESEIVKTKSEKAKPDSGQPAPDKNDVEKFLDDIFGSDEGKTAPDSPDKAQTEPGKVRANETPAQNAQQNPNQARTAKTRPSEPILESKSNFAEGTSNKPSVKEEIREITAAKKEQEAKALSQDDKSVSEKPKQGKSNTHKQPQNNRKSKSKKSKERN